MAPRFEREVVNDERENRFHHNQLEKLEAAKDASFGYLSLPLVTFSYLWLPFLTFGYLSLPFLLPLPTFLYFGYQLTY